MKAQKRRSGFPESLSLDRLAEEFGHPGPQGAEVAVFERPLGPELDGSFKGFAQFFDICTASPLQAIKALDSTFFACPRDPKPAEMII
jgi:hypothetical protein